MKPDQRIFVGVVATIDPHIKTPEEVRDRVLQAANYIPIDRLGTTDDCGFPRFATIPRPRAILLSRKSARESSGQRLQSKRWASADGCRPYEDELLRSAALQNAKSILLARQRAERELIEAKEALQQEATKLAEALAGMRATLESTTDAILVTDGTGRVTDCNGKYVTMWRTPPHILDTRDH